MQSEALRWCGRVANQRQHRGIDRVAPQVLFEAEEKALLLPLPRAPFELAKWSRPKVPPDIHVKVGKTLYSVPWTHIGKVVDARESARTVEIYLEGTLVATHVRPERGKQTNYDHYPPRRSPCQRSSNSPVERRGVQVIPQLDVHVIPHFR